MNRACFYPIFTDHYPLTCPTKNSPSIPVILTSQIVRAGMCLPIIRTGMSSGVRAILSDSTYTDCRVPIFSIIKFCMFSMAAFVMI